ncbi:MAG: hypothetical protein ACRCZP_06450, partial [Phycicoccus sp.]
MRRAAVLVLALSCAATASGMPIAAGASRVSGPPADAVTAPAPGTAEGATVTTFLDGAALPGANGMAFDRQGRLLVVNAAANRISAIDPDDGTVVEQLTPRS